MRQILSLSGGVLSAAKDAFDRMLLATLGRMKKQGIEEGAITLKIDISLMQQFPYDEDGNKREIYVPSFEHKVTSVLSEKDETKGKIDGDYVLEVRDGVPMLYDRDDNTIFDMVDETENGEDNAEHGETG